jgi:hypothetical protein
VLIQELSSSHHPLPPPPEFETNDQEEELKARSFLISDEADFTYLKPLPSPPPIIDINLNIISDDGTGDDDDDDDDDDDEDDTENGANFFLITDSNQATNGIGENSGELEEDQEKLAKLFAEQQEKLSQKKKDKKKPLIMPDPNAKIKYESHKWLLKNINFTRDERIFDVTRMLKEYESNKMSNLFNNRDRGKESETSETTTTENDDEEDEVKIKKEPKQESSVPVADTPTTNKAETVSSPTNLPKEEVKTEKFEIDALKQEWSSMFTKLESEYRLKLEEQQLLNDLKLKTLHEEIKKSIFEQQELIISKQNQQVIYTIDY